MMTPEEEMQDLSGVNDLPTPCRNCGCPAHVGMCETKLPIYRYVNDWKEICGCTSYESMDLEDVLEGEGKI
jgi:hypothetical protein